MREEYALYIVKVNNNYITLNNNNFNNLFKFIKKLLD